MIRGSYSQGYAPRARPVYPSLWDGCVGAWCPSLGPTGVTVRDMSGRGRDGVITNMDAATDWVISGDGYAVDFDGVNDYVATSVSLTAEFSVSMWCLATSLGGRIVWGNLSSVHTYIASVEATAVLVQSNNIGTFKTFSGFSIAVGSWFHLVVSRDLLNSVRVFVNGKESTSGAQTIAGTFTLNALGRYADALGGNAPYQWQGQLDDIRVYSRPTTLGENALLAKRRGIAYDWMLRPMVREADVFNAAWALRQRQIIGGGGGFG